MPHDLPHLDRDPGKVLSEAGIQNPRRVLALIEQAVRRLGLDLSGRVVLTEAASGPFVVTPVIAAIAGADRVLAVTRSSEYATFEEVLIQTAALASLAGIERGVEIHRNRDSDLFGQADLVTNLGFLRPIGPRQIKAMKPTAVIALMYEAWEYRPEDLDLEECEARGIPVLGTNESHPLVNVFSYSGWLALKLLMEAQLEIRECVVAVVSSDQFGDETRKVLRPHAAEVHLLRDLTGDRVLNTLAHADALLVADYTRSDEIIGSGGDLSPHSLKAVNPSLTVVQFAGRVDVQGLDSCGVSVYPGRHLPARRMVKTLAHLGPRPVIDLHAGGLRAGQWGMDMLGRGVRLETALEGRTDLIAQWVASGVDGSSE